ncbi:MAG: M1 family metallopeptidase [Pyrinomonadaceae bacterium]|nr:M1 family metallopeptidase [Pyrinomonadaceae bacterium]
MTKFLLGFTVLIVLAIAGNPAFVHSQRDLGVRPSDSGGPLMPEQAAYDIKSYDLDLHINPAERSIKGVLTAEALIVHPTASFVMDLDPPLTVDSVALLNSSGEPRALNFERRAGKLWIAFPTTKQKGEKVRVRISYGGKPRIAPRPPWSGGFVWGQTADHQPWIGVACQVDGADLWFPVKDHPSDEADTVSLHFTVPEPLVVASNGTLKSVAKNQDGTKTFNWFVSNPINNYNITLNAAPYKTIQDNYTSVSGAVLPVTFWVVPEDYDKGTALVKQTKDYLRFFEDYLGPYPFRSEKIGIAETTYLGMEHQTIISYGNHFRFDADGFDWLMFHELGHEWWGNLVTAGDWRDFWLHEGFQSFMDTLYLERLRGKDAYFQGMTARMKTLRNMQPVAPRESRTTVQMYMAAPDYVRSDGDIYGKGAVILHTLRYLLGDKPFFAALRRMAYPEPAREKLTDGRQVRFATTDEFQRIAETASKTKLDWFFEVYLRQPKLPRLVSERKGDQLELRWESPVSLPFPMPIEVQIGDSTRRYEMPDGTVTVPVEAGKPVVVDPQNWILKAN